MRVKPHSKTRGPAEPFRSLAIKYGGYLPKKCRGLLRDFLSHLVSTSCEPFESKQGCVAHTIQCLSSCKRRWRRRERAQLSRCGVASPHDLRHERIILPAASCPHGQVGTGALAPRDPPGVMNASRVYCNRPCAVCAQHDGWWYRVRTQGVEATDRGERATRVASGRTSW